MIVYVTKYALTQGIEVMEVGSPGDDDGYVYTHQSYHQQFLMGRNAFHTYGEAVIAAREMRDKKTASLMKQLAKVGGLSFPTKMPDALLIQATEDRE